MTGRDASAEDFIHLLSGRWTVALLRQLWSGARHYQELMAGCDGLSHKVLTDTLRRAERDGLIARRLDVTRSRAMTMYEVTRAGVRHKCGTV
jgi:DNA-binding HxlR family transcriptional regulator